MNILLSGASGFIGQQLLKLDGDNVIHRCVTRTVDPNKYTNFYVENIDAHTIWDGAFNNIDAVVHLAGIAHNKSQVKDEIFGTNTEGTIKFAHDAVKAGVKRFVFVSTAAIDDETSFNREASSFQTQSKYDAEVGLKQLADQTGLELVIVRPTLVYGANAPGNFGLLVKLVNKIPISPFGLVNNKRDFISIQNLVSLLLLCASHPNAHGQTFLASDGEPVSIKDFTNAIAKGTNKSLIHFPVPVGIMKAVGRLIGKEAIVEQLVGDLKVDSSKAKRMLGWQPHYSMQQAMQLLLENKQ
ncbi:NAD-dependent epimerase/dehydratase family protein [Vibrio crassostreae]|nr:NAD-dependent epimerase/dehydratase family protein [Vibrio crassostreae]CAK3448242.1 NAD-dependent epimerase/dehydratase family protein [Vibrio crassostreae]